MGCRNCHGITGHTIRCPDGPGPAEAPTAAEVLAAAAALEWPELRAGRYLIAGGRAAWEAFCRVPTPEKLLMGFEALEAFEERWRAEAPTVEEVGA